MLGFSSEAEVAIAEFIFDPAILIVLVGTSSSHNAGGPSKLGFKRHAAPYDRSATIGGPRASTVGGPRTASIEG